MHQIISPLKRGVNINCTRRTNEAARALIPKSQRGVIDSHSSVERLREKRLGKELKAFTGVNKPEVGKSPQKVGPVSRILLSQQTASAIIPDSKFGARRPPRELSVAKAFYS